MGDAKAGRPWKKVGTYDKFSEANDKKKILISEDEKYDIKIRLNSHGFIVISRLKEEYVKNAKKVSSKNRKRK